MNVFARHKYRNRYPSPPQTITITLYFTVLFHLENCKLKQNSINKSYFRLMDNAQFWSLVPVVKIKLWFRIRNRLSKPSLLFSKRMGIGSDDTNLSLDSFFDVQGVYQENADLITWVPRSNFYKKNLTRVFDDICEYCLGRDIRVSNTEGIAICGYCGTVATECVESPMATSENYGPSTAVSMGHSDKPRRVNQYIYKRCNHFRFWLSRVQAKESSGVKPGVVEAVRRELSKERIEVGDSRITYDKVRAMLKKLRLQKYYNNSWFITSVLSGRQAPQLTALQEEKLVSIFHAIQEPFAKHCPKDRVNMMSYAYLLRKMAEALGWFEFASYFPLLKSRAKVHAQDKVWAKICEDIGLPFTKSIS